MVRASRNLIGRPRHLKMYYSDTERDDYLNSRWISNLMMDKQSNLWMASESQGLYKLIGDGKNETFIKYLSDPADDKSIPSLRIYQIYQDSKNNIWVGTVEGLSKYNPDTDDFTTYAKQDGLPNSSVVSIVEDDNHHLWLGTTSGLSRFDPASKTFTNFSTHDGTQGSEFSRFSSTKLSTGEIAIGGMNGFNIFHPDSVTLNPYIPPVYITELKVSNQSIKPGQKNDLLNKHILETNEITFQHDQSIFSLEYIALNYTRSANNQYAFKLEGLENHWNYVGTQRKATYSNLDPGTYTFKVKASNNDGIWNENGRSLKIVVLPVWWATWWARLFFAMILTGGLLMLYITREFYLRNQRDVLEKKVQTRTQELFHQKEALKATNEELEAYDRMISHDLKSPIGHTYMLVQLLKQDKDCKFSRNGMQLMDNIVNSSNASIKLIEGVLDFASADKPTDYKEEVSLKEILKETVAAHQSLLESTNGSVIITGDFPNTNGVAIKLYQLFYNLIANAIKFQEIGNSPLIKIYMSNTNGHNEIFIEDNGIGFDQSMSEKIFKPLERIADRTKYDGYGIGLGTCKRIVEFHGWGIRAESEIGTGSKFIISI